MSVDVLLADVVQQRDLNEVEARALVDGMRRDVSDLGERIAVAYLSVHSMKRRGVLRFGGDA